MPTRKKKSNIKFLYKARKAKGFVVCRNKANCPHVEPRPVGGVLSVGFCPTPYLCEENKRDCDPLNGSAGGFYIKKIV